MMTDAGRPGPSRTRRTRLAVTAAIAGALLMAVPAEAYVTKVHVLYRDGQILVVQQDVGNQAFHYQWVENDPTRHGDDGLTLYYRIDLTESELPDGISAGQVEAAIEAAVDTFRHVRCGRSLRLVRLAVEPGANLGFIQNEVGFGGETEPHADITFAGWLPASFMAAVGLPGSFGVTLPLAFETDGSLAWGLDVWDPSRTFFDVNHDRKADMWASEIYFNRDWNYVTDNKELADTLFYIDVQTIVAHEFGHALGMGHFGRSILVLDDGYGFVDLVVNPNSANLMNTNGYYQMRELAGSDVASFCELYANWGVGRATG